MTRGVRGKGGTGWKPVCTHVALVDDNLLGVRHLTHVSLCLEDLAALRRALRLVRRRTGDTLRELRKQRVDACGARGAGLTMTPLGEQGKARSSMEGSRDRDQLTRTLLPLSLVLLERLLRRHIRRPLDEHLLMHAPRELVQQALLGELLVSSSLGLGARHALLAQLLLQQHHPLIRLEQEGLEVGALRWRDTPSARDGEGQGQGQGQDQGEGQGERGEAERTSSSMS